jgi:hypothetical protein
MAGYVVMGDNRYEGTLEAAQAFENGMFVVPDYSAGTAGTPTGDGTGEIRFIENEIDTVAEEGIDDADYSIASGDYLKLKTPKNGEILITDKFTPTYASITDGDEMGVDVTGNLALIGDLDAANFTTFRYTFIVKDKVKLWGNDALKVVAIVK